MIPLWFSCSWWFNFRLHSALCSHTHRNYTLFPGDMGPRAQGWALDRRGQNHRGVHLWPYLRFQHLLNFAGNSFSTSISKLQAGKRRSKKPRSQFFAQKASVPLHNPAFPLFAPSQYLSSFSSYRPKSIKDKFFTSFRVALVKLFVGLLRSQFWCHRPRPST